MKTIVHCLTFIANLAKNITSQFFSTVDNYNSFTNVESFVKYTILSKKTKHIHSLIRHVKLSTNQITTIVSLYKIYGHHGSKEIIDDS